MKHCKYHCACCDLHFNSLKAFDAHRKGGSCRLRPRDTKTVEWVEVEGICNLTKGLIGRRVPCLIWQNSAERTYYLETSQSDSKPTNQSSKVIPHLSSKDGLESNGGGAEKASGVSSTTTLDSAEVARYTSGSYRQVCRSCGEPIQRTGRRGRPPTHHQECRT